MQQNLQNRLSIYLNDLSNKSFGLLFFNGFSVRRIIANSLSLSSGSLLHPACISSVLLVIHSLGHHRPFLQYSKGHHHVSSFSFCYCFWWNFSFEAPEALDLPISAAASVVTLVALLACTGASTIVSFSSYIWSLFVMRTCIDTDHSLTSCIFISHM